MIDHHSQPPMKLTFKELVRSEHYEDYTFPAFVGQLTRQLTRTVS